MMERQSGTTSISVMWYYTKEFEAITSDPALYMASLVNHANTAYQNSNLDLRLTTMCIERLPDSFVEADDVNALFNNFYNAKGEFSTNRPIRLRKNSSCLKTCYEAD